MSCEAMSGDAAELQAGGSRGSRPPSRGSPEAPPLELPAPPDIQSSILRQMRLYAERRGRGQSVPPHPLGRYAEAPAAGLCPSAARREFPKSRLAAGAMLISPMLFIVLSDLCPLSSAIAWSVEDSPNFSGTFFATFVAVSGLSSRTSRWLSADNFLHLTAKTYACRALWLTVCKLVTNRGI